MSAVCLCFFTRRSGRTGADDEEADGDRHYQIILGVLDSDDPDYANAPLVTIDLTNIDDEPADQRVTDDTHTARFRAMAANITSGSAQSYSPGHGLRIFQAVKPDIVLIQEFNMYSSSKDTDADIRAMVDDNFGKDFYYHHGKGQIPNGIISRYPITSSGYWSSNVITNRNWDWAVIDIPGETDLLAVSVHLSTSKNKSEMPQLMKKINDKIDKDAKLGKNYYVLLGGDFNTSSRSSVKSHMSSVFVTAAPYPVDQKGNDATNAARAKPYDWLLCSYELCKKEIPVEIGAHTGINGYTNGHVFDSRVYAKYAVDGKTKEISYVQPVRAADSGASNMQHMAVIRDFEYEY